MRTLPGVRCMLSVALHVVVARCMLLEVWRMLQVARCLLRVACRPLHGACCLSFSVARCVSSVAFCLLRVACGVASVAQFPVVLHALPCVSSAALLSVGSGLLRVVCGLFSCCPPKCPMSRGVRCLSVARSHVRISSGTCSALRVVCWMLQNARSLLLLVSCPCRSHSGTSSRCTMHDARSQSHGFPCTSSVACRRCRATQRRRIRGASRRRSQLSASVAKVCVRACAPACVRAGSKRDGVNLRVAVRAWGCAACATALRAMCAGMSCVRAFG